MSDFADKKRSVFVLVRTLAEHNKPQFDVAIIGGGPAGLSAALWCADLGLGAVLIEREVRFGGQLSIINNSIQNYLGLDVKNGTELRDLFLQHVENKRFERRVSVTVIKADLEKKLLQLSDGSSVSSGAIIIATGVSRRRLGIDGESKFQGRGILRSGAAEKESVAGKTVIIVGGGDAALENALILCEIAARVIIVHRRSQCTARAQFVDAAKQKPNIDFVPDTTLTAILGTNNVEAVILRHTQTGKENQIATDALLVRIGVVPNSEVFAGQVVLDKAGYICVDSKGMTSTEGVFAVGDVANPASPTISTGVGNGATAAKFIASRIIFPLSN